MKIFQNFGEFPSLVSFFKLNTSSALKVLLPSRNPTNHRNHDTCKWRNNYAKCKLLSSHLIITQSMWIAIIKSASHEKIQQHRIHTWEIYAVTTRITISRLLFCLFKRAFMQYSREKENLADSFLPNWNAIVK